MGASESTAAAVVAEGHGQGPGVAPPPSAQRRTSFSDGSAPGAALDHVDSSELVSSVLTDAGGELSPHQQRVQRIMGDKYPPLAWAPGARAPAPAPDASACTPGARRRHRSGAIAAVAAAAGAPLQWWCSTRAVLDPTTTATPPGPAAAASIQPASRDGGRSGSGTSTLSASGSINGARPAPVMVPALLPPQPPRPRRQRPRRRASLPAHSRVTPLGPVSHQAVSAQRCSAKSLSRLYSLPSLDNLPSPPPHASAHAHQAPPAPALCLVARSPAGARRSARRDASEGSGGGATGGDTPACAARRAPLVRLVRLVWLHRPRQPVRRAVAVAAVVRGRRRARRAAQQALLARESIERRARMSAHKEQVLRLEAEEAPPPRAPRPTPTPRGPPSSRPRASTSGRACGRRCRSASEQGDPADAPPRARSPARGPPAKRPSSCRRGRAGCSRGARCAAGMARPSSANSPPSRPRGRRERPRRLSPRRLRDAGAYDASQARPGRTGRRCIASPAVRRQRAPEAQARAHAHASVYRCVYLSITIRLYRDI